MASDTAETKWRRYQQLRESGVIDANTYDEVRSQRDQSKVELDSAMQQSKQTEASAEGSARAAGQDRAARADLRSPHAVKIKIGETAVPSATSIAGSDLLVIADTTNLYAEVNVNETDVARVVPGQEARIVPAAFPDKSWEGTVETVAVSPNQVAGQGKSYLVKIRLTKSDDLQFHTGMSCRAEIVTLRHRCHAGRRGAGAGACSTKKPPNAMRPPSPACSSWWTARPASARWKPAWPMTPTWP